MIEPDLLVSLLGHIKYLDIDFGVQLIGSVSIYEKTLRQTIRLIPTQVEQLERFLNNDDDLHTFAIEIHGVKGALSQLGCKTLANYAASLEEASKSNDKENCLNSFSNFKEQLLDFYELVTNVFNEHGQGSDNIKYKHGKSISDFTDILTQAKVFAQDFDCIQASKALNTLLIHRFDEDTDKLIKSITKSLEAFQPMLALTHILSLLDKCNKALSPPDMEE